MLDRVEDEEVRRIAVHEAAHAVAFSILHGQSIERITWTWDRDGEIEAHTDNAGWSVNLQDDADRRRVQNERIDVGVAGGVAEARMLGLRDATAEERRHRVGEADVRCIRTILTDMRGTEAGWEDEVEAAWTRVETRLTQADTRQAIEGLATALANRRMAMFRYGFELAEPAPDLIMRAAGLDLRIECSDAESPTAGQVRAFDEQGHEVGSVTFHYKPPDGFSHPRLELDLVKVHDDYQGTGLAYRLVEDTIALHPNSVTVVSPEVINEHAGNDFIRVLRAQAHLIHDQQCYREQGECRCPLAL